MELSELDTPARGKFFQNIDQALCLSRQPIDPEPGGVVLLGPKFALNRLAVNNLEIELMGMQQYLCRTI